ncbi:redox-sensing transcriptional repressor Rex [soil metagenome]
MSRGKANASTGALSRAAAFRLSQYLRCIPATPLATVSSGQLAETVGVSDAQVRRDLAAVGHQGQRGIGYDAEALSHAIRKTLGIHRPWRAALVGTGNLARALLRYKGFQKQGFDLVGLFDIDPAKIGTSIEGITVSSLDSLSQRVKALKAELGVITVPAEAAQGVADQLVAAGVKGLLNFAPTLVKVPPRVSLVSVDLSIQFEQLAFQVGLSPTEK